MAKFRIKGDVSSKEFLEIFILSLAIPVLYWVFSGWLGGQTFTTMAIGGDTVGRATTTITYLLLFVLPIAVYLIARVWEAKGIPSKQHMIAGFGRGVMFILMVLLVLFLFNMPSVSLAVLWVASILALFFAEFTLDEMVARVG